MTSVLKSKHGPQPLDSYLPLGAHSGTVIVHILQVGQDEVNVLSQKKSMGQGGVRAHILLTTT
jgi:hypothetical protein